MDAHRRAFEALSAHPRARELNPRSALAVLSILHGLWGRYPANLATSFDWAIGLLDRYAYLRRAVEQEGPEQWAYQLRLAGIGAAQRPDLARRLDRSASEIVASLADAPDAVGFAVIMPQDALDYMNRVNVAVEIMNEDVRRSGIMGKDAAFYWGWSDWHSIWWQFYQEHLPWHARLNSAAVYDETEVKERELKEWRKRFEAKGGQPTAPPPQGPGAGDQPGKSPTLGDIGMALAQGAAVVAGLGVVTYIVMRKA